MKFLKSSLFFAVTLFSISFVSAQTVDDIINKYIDAIGGKDKLSKISTLYTESSSEGMGKTMEIIAIIVNGKGAKTEMDMGGVKNIFCTTDTSAWIINGIAGDTNAMPLPMGMVKRQKNKMDILGPLYNYAAKGNKVALLPNEKLGDINVYKILVTLPDSSHRTTYYIDPTTYYALKIVSEVKVPGQENNFVFGMALSNYRKTDYGYVMPFTTEGILQQGSMTITVKKVEVNKVIDPKLFDMPK